MKKAEGLAEINEWVLGEQKIHELGTPLAP
jgi:hypothetical protein